MYSDGGKMQYVKTKLRIGNAIYDGYKQQFPSLIIVASYKETEIFATKKKPFDDRNMI
jgi:hypothetical protein